MRDEVIEMEQHLEVVKGADKRMLIWMKEIYEKFVESLETGKAIEVIKAP